MKLDNRLKVRLAALIVTAALLVAVACGSNSSSNSFRWVACPDYFDADASAQCGILRVPLHHEQTFSGYVENTVVIFKALGNMDGDTNTGPIFFLNGGPGSTNLYAHEAFMSPDGSMRQLFGTHRDIVITSQRGTNDSTPSLYYEGLADDRVLAYEMDLDAESAQRIDATMENYDRFVEAGIDLSAYNTLEIAADVKALRDRLYPGQKINIWSASYGTRLAMTVMKRYPDMLRSVVLDSILPPEINPFIDEVRGILYAMDQFFDACRDDYPELEGYYDAIIARLDNDPVDDVPYAVGGVTYSVGITATKFFLFVKGSIQDTPYDESLPQKIIDIYNGDYTEIAKAWIGNVDYEFPVGDATDGQTCDAVFESVFAATDASFVTHEETEAAIDANVEIESIKKYFRHQFIYGYPCSEGSWVVDTLPTSMQEPVVGDVPTLMVTGTLDPQTPAIFSRDAAELLTNSYYHEILGGHAVSNLACVQDMMVDFYAAPHTAPVNPCSTTYTWSAAPLTTQTAPKIRSRLFPRQ